MLEEAGLGKLVTDGWTPGHEPDLRDWRTLVERIGAPRPERADRASSASTSSCTTRTSASPRRSSTPAIAHGVDVDIHWINSEELERSAPARSRRLTAVEGVVVARRLRLARRGGEDPARRYAREHQRPLPRPLPRDADGGDRIRAPRPRHRGGEQHRDRRAPRTR